MKCKDCKHWGFTKEYGGADDCASPYDLDYNRIEDPDQQRRLFGHATAYCLNPRVQFYERPRRDGVCVADGSEYMAVMITGEDFGCTMYEDKREGVVSISEASSG